MDPLQGSRVFAFAISTELGEDARLQLLHVAAQECPSFAAFQLIRGVFFAQCTSTRAEDIAQLVGVTAWRTSDVQTARLIRSIDSQLMIALAHELQIAPNGVRNAVPIGELFEGRPLYPVLSFVGGQPRWTNDLRTVLPTRSCYVGALNISLENRTREAEGTFDPVSTALTEAARQLPVTIAAGNVSGDPDPTIFGWALNPDVITVGAVDPDEVRLLEVSRVGTPSGLAGPDVVANGVDETGKVGTSFAAPVAATQLALIAAALMAVRAVARAGSDFPEGAPLAGRCFVDWDRALASVGGHAFKVTDFRARERALPALPLGVVTADAGALLSAQASAVQHRPGAERLRQALLDSARPIRGLQAHEVGRGVVSLNTTHDYLARLTIADLGSLYREPSLTSVVRVFDERLLGAFLCAAQQSMIGWAAGITDFDGVGGNHFVEPAPGSRADPG